MVSLHNPSKVEADREHLCSRAGKNVYLDQTPCSTRPSSGRSTPYRLAPIKRLQAPSGRSRR